MPNEDLPPMPEPKIEPGEPNPGGVDAIDAEDGEPAIPDLPTAKNPATDDAAMPDEVKQTEDTSTQATEDESEPEGAETEPSA
jgi:hypothetical protein